MFGPISHPKTDPKLLDPMQLEHAALLQGWCQPHRPGQQAIGMRPSDDVHAAVRDRGVVQGEVHRDQGVAVAVEAGAHVLVPAEHGAAAELHRPGR